MDGGTYAGNSRRRRGRGGRRSEREGGSGRGTSMGSMSRKSARRRIDKTEAADHLMKVGVTSSSKVIRHKAIEN